MTWNYCKEFCVSFKWWNKFNSQFVVAVGCFWSTLKTLALCMMPMAFGMVVDPCSVNVNATDMFVFVSVSVWVFVKAFIMSWKLWFISDDDNGCLVVCCVHSGSCLQRPNWPHCRQHRILSSGLCWCSVWKLKTFLHSMHSLKRLWKKKEKRALEIWNKS